MLSGKRIEVHGLGHKFKIRAPNYTVQSLKLGVNPLFGLGFRVQDSGCMA